MSPLFHQGNAISYSSRVLFPDTLTGALCLVVPHTGEDFPQTSENLPPPSITAHLRGAERSTSPRLLLCKATTYPGDHYRPLALLCCSFSAWGPLPPLPDTVRAPCGRNTSGFEYLAEIIQFHVLKHKWAQGKCREAGPGCSYSSRESGHVHLLGKPLNWILPRDVKVCLRTLSLL